MHETRRVGVIGHRGAAGIEPENTLRSFRKAIELGVDAIECDVHMTRDARAVLIHDATLDRTTGGTGAVNEKTFDEIRTLDAGLGERVPTLRELLDLARGLIELHVELKDPTAVDRVLEEIAGAGMRGAAIPTCFDTDVLKHIRARDAEIRLEHIFGDPPADAVSRALSVRAARISCNFRHLSEAFVAASHDAGLQVVAWAPDTPDEQQRAIDLGVDFICTNRPDVLLELLRATPG